MLLSALMDDMLQDVRLLHKSWWSLWFGSLE